MAIRSQLFSITALLLLLAGCAPANTPPPTSTVTKTVIQTPTKTTLPSETPSPRASPTRTLRPRPSATLTPTFTPFPSSTSTPTQTPIPIAPGDRFLNEMQQKGYHIDQAGSIVDSDSLVYTAYIFSNMKYPGDYGFSKPDSRIIGFYCWDGKENLLIGNAYPSWYSKHEPVYPAYFYRLANWDDPWNSMQGVAIDEYPDARTRELLQLHGYSSDINQNGRPEFIFAAEYCPISCSRTTDGFDYFEIRNSHQVVNLAKGLPGRIVLHPISETPLTFEVNDSYWYGFFSEIYLPTFISWNGQGFEDVTRQHIDDLLTRVETLTANIEAQYGQPFGSEPTTTSVYQVLMLYQQMGMRQKGLETFLRLTDIQNWPSTMDQAICWLQLSRARAQEDYLTNREFSMIPATIYWLVYEHIIDEWVKPLDKTKYDLSACYQLISGP
jgi:hypothetical protein